MTSVSSALDNIATLRLGENGSAEYSWSKNLNEEIFQLYFQLVRTQSSDDIMKHFKSILTKILNLDNNQLIYYFEIITKIILFTRDIESGKGEYQLTYELISTMYNHLVVSKEFSNHSQYKNFHLPIMFLIESLVIPLNSENEHPIGSWKDLKYLLNTHISREKRYSTNLKNDHIAMKCFELYKNQLGKDINAVNPSLMAKWVPRENSKFGWITPFIACSYYSNIYKTAKTSSQINKARLKCLTLFRIEISKINRKLNTVQINQCENSWRQINFEKNVTSITLSKQKKAFMGIGKSQPNAGNELSDRMACANNFNKFTTKISEGKISAKGKRVSIYDFVKNAIDIQSRYDDQVPYVGDQVLQEIALLDSQWKNNLKQNLKLKNVIPMCDTSGSMEIDQCIPLFNAIGLSIRIAELSSIKDRILTFSSHPTWINLSGINNFCQKVKKVKQSSWSMNTNFASALKLILDAAIQNNLHPNEFTDITLLVFSDMQIDNAGKPNETMFENIKRNFHEAGMMRWNVPYTMPHIVFWNLRKTSGFPTVSNEKNVTCISGYSPVLINKLMEIGIDELKSTSSFDIMLNSLNCDRYSRVKHEINKYFANSIYNAAPPPSPILNNNTFNMDLD